jgi:hypothetical protein
MNYYNILRGLAEEKRCFMVSKGDDVRFVMGKSVEQVMGKFRKWNVKEISVAQYVSKKLDICINQETPHKLV